MEKSSFGKYGVKSSAGTWVGNVFYSDIIFDRYVDNVAKQQLESSFFETFPSDTEK